MHHTSGVHVSLVCIRRRPSAGALLKLLPICCVVSRSEWSALPTFSPVNVSTANKAPRSTSHVPPWSIHRDFPKSLQFFASLARWRGSFHCARLSVSSSIDHNVNICTKSRRCQTERVRTVCGVRGFGCVWCETCETWVRCGTGQCTLGKV